MKRNLSFDDSSSIDDNPSNVKKLVENNELYDIDLLKELPLETLFKIIKESDISEVWNLCNSSNYFHRNICRNSHFWKYYLYDPDIKDFDDDLLTDLLVNAAKNKDLEAVKMFMELKPINKNFVLFEKSTPEIYHFMIKNGAEENRKRQIKSGFENGKLDYIKFLLEELGFDLDKSNINKLFLYSINLRDYLDVFKYLVAYIHKNPHLLENYFDHNNVIETLYKDNKFDALNIFINTLGPIHPSILISSIENVDDFLNIKDAQNIFKHVLKMLNDNIHIIKELHPSFIYAIDHDNLKVSLFFVINIIDKPNLMPFLEQLEQDTIENIIYYLFNKEMLNSELLKMICNNIPSGCIMLLEKSVGILDKDKRTKVFKFLVDFISNKPNIIQKNRDGDAINRIIEEMVEDEDEHINDIKTFIHKLCLKIPFICEEILEQAFRNNKNQLFKYILYNVESNDKNFINKNIEIFTPFIKHISHQAFNYATGDIKDLKQYQNMLKMLEKLIERDVYINNVIISLEENITSLNQILSNTKNKKKQEKIEKHINTLTIMFNELRWERASKKYGWKK